jgi:hypothetical protein
VLADCPVLSASELCKLVVLVLVLVMLVFS